ncbi:unnamed protein product [Rotaria magnacalcarata]|uniref:Integrase catalytic domain-containing protein n=1 Tax=Rotaria magnacalcarata TaxID=392030 RepID=A0A816ZIW7_9BILA|nr:unnamed protein product [Rotaria magnacalcarata]CAF4150832.1 unnamed protein product [Rotaria magnacalcarata]
MSAGIKDDNFLKMIDECSENCDICRKYKKACPRPVVGLPLAREFNDTVAMDLKDIGSYKILHLIDHATRYSAACVVKNKTSNEIIDSIFKIWISVFGSPRQFLSDNGGEFNNDEFRQMAEAFNVIVRTTAAESPWSNGLNERHNGVLGVMVLKILADVKCSFSTALAWAISAKNTLHNAHGYSPNQLVFGKNPNFPSVLTDFPPALENKFTSEIVANTLNTIHAARQAFMMSESSERIRRALRHNIRSFTNEQFVNGDLVYYKRNNFTEWKGPGTVIGSENQQVLVKHGGTYVRVHPSKLMHATMNAWKHEIPISSVATDQVEEVKSNEKKVEKMFTDQSDDEDDSEEDLTSGRETLKEIRQENNIFLPEPVNSSKAGKTCLVPKIKDHIKYLIHDNESWKSAEVISKAGKATGINKLCMNLKDLKDNSLSCVDFGRIKEWKQLDNDSMEENSALLAGFDDDELLKAKMIELDNWKKLSVYEEVPFTNQNCVSVRWVCTKKINKGVSCIKARLVARGFEEEYLTNIRKDSPTCSREGFRIVLSIMISRGWTCNSMDVKTAFLQGKGFDRDVFLKPPCEANCGGSVWKLLTCVYGLSDASRIWYLKVKDTLTTVGVECCQFDPAIFKWYKDGDLQGIISTHVDDFCWGGTDLFVEKVISVIRETFDIGKEEASIFKYVGLNLDQKENNIDIDQKAYISDIQPITIGKGRLLRHKDSLNQEEVHRLRVLMGQMNWVTGQTRPDMAYEVCALSTTIGSATIGDIVHANKILNILKTVKVSLQFPDLGEFQHWKIVCFSDASYANLPDGSSQGGYLVFLVGKHNQANFSRSFFTPLSLLISEISNSRTASRGFPVSDKKIAGPCLALLSSVNACQILISFFQDS